MVKNFLSTALILMVLCFFFALQLPESLQGRQNIDGIIQEIEYAQSKSFGNGVFELHWRIVGDEVYIAMKARTTGWVSLGIDPSVRMKDADMIIGWVENNGETKIFDAFSTGEMGPHPPDDQLGGTNDITEYAGKIADGYTTIEFKRKLDTGDKFDKPFPRSGDLKVIVAYGARKDFNSMHTFRTTGVITIEEPKEEKKYTEISAVEAKKLYDDDPSLMILDVSGGWKDGHLPGAVNIGFNQVSQNLDKLDKTRPILVYCHGDGPAIFVADLLGRNGFERVYRLLGNYSAWVRAGYPVEKYKELTVVKFQIGKTSYLIDNDPKTMDTEPVIIEGRTMLPIRFLAEAIGARVGWNASTQEVSIFLQFIHIRLRINHPTAIVNGRNTPIDPANDKVMPIIVPPGRTLLPLRFVAENLQCEVEWNASTREVTVKYTP